MWCAMQSLQVHDGTEKSTVWFWLFPLTSNTPILASTSLTSLLVYFRLLNLWWRQCSIADLGLHCRYFGTTTRFYSLYKLVFLKFWNTYLYCNAGMNSSINLITKKDNVKFFYLGRNLYFSSLFIASTPLFVLITPC